MANSRSGLVAVRRMNKNGVLVTKHVRADKAASLGGPALPPPPPPAPAAPKASFKSAHVAESSDPRVQAGEVIDRIVHDGRLYSRVGEGMAPGEFGMMRIQASRPLADSDAEKIASIVGYAARSVLHTSKRSEVEVEGRDSPYSVVLYTDSANWSHSNDFRRVAARFHRLIPEMLSEGTPERTTNSRWGAKGTRAVHGFGEDGLSFELYYNEVDGDRGIETATERGTLDIEALDAVLSHEVSALSDGML